MHVEAWWPILNGLATTGALAAEVRARGNQ